MPSLTPIDIGYLSRYAVVLHPKRQKRLAFSPLCPAFVRRVCFAIPKNATLTIVAFQLLVRIMIDLWRRQHGPLAERLPDRLCPLRFFFFRPALRIARRASSRSAAAAASSHLLNAPRFSSLLLGFAGRLSCSLASFRGRSLCGFTRYQLAPGPLSFRDPDVAGGDNLRSSLHSPQPSGVFCNYPGTFNLSLLRSAGST